MAVSSLAGTGRGAGVDMVVMAGAGIMRVDMVSIFPEPGRLCSTNASMLLVQVRSLTEVAPGLDRHVH